MDDSATEPQDSFSAAPKRKRSPSAERPSHSAPPSKTAKVSNSHLQINYLARQYTDTLPLISTEDTLPGLLGLIGEYIGVLDRHESMAGNLGARPLGPILIKRFERLFESPPRVLKTHGKEGTTVTWLDVVEFARHKPEQFNLEKMRDGVRVCQFYTKQSRVEISEEDYVLIASGMPQKLIPPQPIAEDEEKELGTLEILENNIGKLVQLTDQVAGRARQLNHRIRNRKNAIIQRRESEAEASSAPDRGSPSDLQIPEQTAGNGTQRESSSPTSGFVAVNSRQSNYKDPTDSQTLQKTTNGKAFAGASASPATRAELLSYFTAARERLSDSNTVPDYENQKASARPHSVSKPKAKASNEIVDAANALLNAASPVAIPNTPSSYGYAKSTAVDRFDDGGPCKAEMLSRMDSMQRGDRVIPPCDRCRRLHMDCLKNLTACLGCTKKHAKCSWKDVTEQELRDNPYVPRPKAVSAEAPANSDVYTTPIVNADGTPTGVADEELLGEESDDGKEQSTHIPSSHVTILSLPNSANLPPSSAVDTSSELSAQVPQSSAMYTTSDHFAKDNVPGTATEVKTQEMESGKEAKNHSHPTATSSTAHAATDNLASRMAESDDGRDTTPLSDVDGTPLRAIWGAKQPNGA